MAIDATNIVEVGAGVATSEPIRGTLSDVWQAVLGDRIAAWRLKRAAEIQVRAKREFDRLGLKPDINRIPERFAITWFEEASKQDEQEIQELFARILARAASGNDDALDRRNLEVVSKLTPNDAALFLELAEGGWGGRRVQNTYYWDESKNFISFKTTKVDNAQFSRSYEHLITLGILSRTAHAEERLNGRSLSMGQRVETVVKNIVIMTETGLSIYRAVKL